MKSLPLNGIFSDTQIDLTIKKKPTVKRDGWDDSKLPCFLDSNRRSRDFGAECEGDRGLDRAA